MISVVIYWEGGKFHPILTLKEKFIGKGNNRSMEGKVLVLNSPIIEGYKVSRGTSQRVTSTCNKYSTTKELLWVTTLEVAGEKKRRRIIPLPHVMVLKH